MKTLMVILSLTLTSVTVFAATNKENALKYVPEGTVVQEKAKEVKVQTIKGSLVEIEFHPDGTLEEASGDNLESDLFIPGGELLSLKDAQAALKKAGKNPAGDWSLEKSFLGGWVYEFEGFESGVKMDYKVDAKSGKLTESKQDN